MQELSVLLTNAALKGNYIVRALPDLKQGDDWVTQPPLDVLSHIGKIKINDKLS